MLGFGFILKYT